MAPKLAKGMDALGELSDDDGSDEEKAAAEPAAAAKKICVSVEDLQRAGYRGGPSVLHVKEACHDVR